MLEEVLRPGSTDVTNVGTFVRNEIPRLPGPPQHVHGLSGARHVAGQLVQRRPKHLVGRKCSDEILERGNRVGILVHFNQVDTSEHPAAFPFERVGDVK
ncbi:hypothetical protein ACH121_24185 [Streptomyces sp. NB004]